MNIKERINQFRNEFNPIFGQEVERLIKEQRQFHSSQTILDEHLSKIIGEYCSEGKRIRPFLIQLFAEKNLENEEMKNLALASELFHLAAIIHDDVIDESQQRRGSSTINASAQNHARHNLKLGDHVGILLGDVFMTASLDLASQLPEKIFKEFVLMIQRTIRGQYLDVFGMNEAYGTSRRQDIIARHDLKTAWYTFASPATMGYLLNDNHNKERQEIIMNILREIGLLYQIRDDIIDCIDESSGKALFGDIFENQTTWVTLYIKEHDPDIFEEIIKAKDAKDREQLKLLFADIDLRTPYETEYQECYEMISNIDDKFSDLKARAHEVLDLLVLNQ